MTARCCDCAKATSGQGARCKSCAAKAKYRDPDARAKVSEGKKRSLSRDPAQLAKLLNSLSKAQAASVPNPNFGAEMRDRRMSGIPRERWPEFSRLCRSFGAAEARRIIEEDIKAQVRRGIARAAVEARDAA